MSTLADIQVTLLEIFNKNKNYFRNNNLDIYNKVTEFEKLNKETFFIDFIDNNFELIDNNNNRTYNCDPFFDANHRANNLDNNNIIELIAKQTNNNIHYSNNINAYEFINEYNNKDINLEINKFIFIGTLLGVHINDIHKKIDAKTYLIIEPNIEIFRLSMFLTDYTELCKSSKVLFCIAFNKIEFKNKINQFYMYEYKYNTKIRFELASKNELYLINDISIELMQNSPMTYPFSEYIISMNRGYKYIKKSKNGILNTLKVNNIFSNKPVLYLGAGPSISKCVEWIYLNQDRFIIVASSAILKKLELLNIIPDIIIVIDGQKDVVIRQFEVSKKMYLNSIILASIKIDEELFDKLSTNKLYLIQDSFELFEGYGILTGVTVGDIGILLLKNLGVEKLYLLGFDACIDPITGKTHDSSHHSLRKINTNNSGNTYSDHIVKVQGNFQKEVDTFIFYTGMIDNISSMLSNSNMSVYNLANGAYFEHSKALKKEDIDFSDLDLIDKELFQENTMILFSKYSKKDLDKKDLAYLKKEKKVLDKLLRLKITNIEKDILKLKSSYKNSVFIQIIEKFLILTSAYKYQKEQNITQQKQLEIILKEFKKLY